MVLRYLDRPVTGMHLEVTNRCALRCAECVRTPLRGKLPATDLPLELVQRTFTVEMAAENDLAIVICGTYGDLVFHPQLHELVAHLKALGLPIRMTTTGSHRDREWWQRLVALLDPSDSVAFSIDGLEDTNHRYRQGADWASIMTALSCCVDRVQTSWKVIVFRHNEHQLDEIVAFARDMGVDQIRINKSGRVPNPDHPLVPQDPVHHAVKAKNKAALLARLARHRGGDPDALAGVRIVPRCASPDNVTIFHDGSVFPCCIDVLDDPWFVARRAAFDLHRVPLAEVLAARHWRELAASWPTPSEAPRACLLRCGISDELWDEYGGDPRYPYREGVDNRRIRFKPGPGG